MLQTGHFLIDICLFVSYNSCKQDKKIKWQTDTHYEQKGKYYSMKWHVTDGKENVKSFDTHSETQEFVRDHPDWYELMS